MFQSFSGEKIGWLWLACLPVSSKSFRQSSGHRRRDAYVLRKLTQTALNVPSRQRKPQLRQHFACHLFHRFLSKKPTSIHSIPHVFNVKTLAPPFSSYFFFKKFLFSRVYLSVCLLAKLLENLWTDTEEIFRKWEGLDDPGICWKFLCSLWDRNNVSIYVENSTRSAVDCLWHVA